MHLFKKTIFLLILVLFLFPILQLHIGSAASKTEDKKVVEMYLSALLIGDVQTIKNCLGNRLLQRKKNTLEDPGYSSFLLDRYNGATFSIIDSVSDETGKNKVDVEITFISGDKMKIRLTLKNNKITDEIIL